MQSVAAFEAVATSGTGVLQTLTTISKRVIRHLRERKVADPATAPDSAQVELAEPTPPPGTSQILETAATSPDAPTAWYEEILDDSAALDPVLVCDEDHPDAAAIEATATKTEAAFEPSFRQVTVELEAPTQVDSEPDAPATMEEFRIESVGEARQTASGGVRIPILLRDEAGRSLAISLSLEIEATKTEIGD
jgi:hypothetical protein